MTNQPNINNTPKGLIAITGGIGTGKSTVQAYLKQQGQPVIDADDITHDLYAHDLDLKKAVLDTLGVDAFDDKDPTKAINRAYFAPLAFTRPDVLKALTGVIHPKVRQTIAAFIEEHRDKERVFVAIPILYESKQAEQYDSVWLVYAPRQVQIERLMASRGYSKTDCENRLDHQIDIEAKRDWANIVIDNSGPLEQTYAQLDALLTSAPSSEVSV